MARYATGKKAWGFSDRSGFRYRLREMKTEWNGLKVGSDEYEEKHPQLKPSQPGPDPTALYQPRVTSRTEVTVENLLGLNVFSTGAINTSIITVLEPLHGRSSDDIVRFRSVSSFDGITSTILEKSEGYTITKINDNKYKFTVSSGTATVGNTTGGGGISTVGPVTLGT